MGYRHIFACGVALLLSQTVFALERGNLVIEMREAVPYVIPTDDYMLWVHTGHSYTFGLGFDLIYKIPPFSGAGHLLAPAPDLYALHSDRTVLLWDGHLEVFTTPGLGWNEVFTAETDLSEFAPMRNGHFLVAESFADVARGVKLIEFDAHGIVAEYAFPQLIDPVTHRAVGAAHLELLGDQCTVLYTTGLELPLDNRVRALDICTRQPRADFAQLAPNQYGGSIRQLPNGDVLVANGNAMLQFNAGGALLRTYALPGVTHLSLSPDGTTFWTVTLENDVAFLRQFDPNHPDITFAPVAFGNPESVTGLAPVATDDLVTIGEWRAATAPVRKSRATRH
jgi:hypothetical protein